MRREVQNSALVEQLMYDYLEQTGEVGRTHAAAHTLQLAVIPLARLLYRFSFCFLRV
jgi:hypothetical protein